MAAPETVEFEVEYDGRTWRAVVDEAAIAGFEDATDRSIVEIAGVDGRPPKLSLLGAFLAAALSRYHPGLTREDGMRMLREPGVQEKLMGGAVEAMPQPGDIADADGDNGEAGGTPPADPPKKRRAGKGGKTASSRPPKRA
jgi:hypothetical protein